MRVNIYAEEMLDRVDQVDSESRGGKPFYGLRITLLTHPDMMPPLHDGDDSSAVTFWFETREARGLFAARIGNFGAGLR